MSQAEVGYRFGWAVAVVLVFVAVTSIQCRGRGVVGAGQGSIAAAGELALPATPGRSCDGTQPLPSQVLGCVDGVAISAREFIDHQADYPPSVSQGARIDAAINGQLLASAATASGLWAGWLMESLKRAMVVAYLERYFEQNHLASAVQEEDLRRAYGRSAIRVKFKHAPAYFVSEAQFICCRGDWRDCERKPGVSGCIDALKSKAEEVYQRLASDLPQSGLEMEAKAMVIGQTIPQLSVKQHAFYYDKEKAHKDQKDYDLMVEPYARAVTKLQPGALSEPIRTPFGWHIVRLNSAKPAKTADLHDPAVRSEIAANILPLVRNRDVQKHIFGEMKARGVKIHFDRLVGQGS